jgi:hypothetical protein
MPSPTTSRTTWSGTQLLKQHFLSGAWATVVNGWRYAPANEGRFGDELLYRAADHSLAGIIPNDLEEAVYLVNFTDDSGAKFSGDSRYELQFTGDTLPRVDAFSCSARGRRVPCADIGRSLISSDDCLDVSSLVVRLTFSLPVG